MTDLASELAALVGADHVVTDAAERRYLSRDLFPWEDAPTALAVVAPGTVEEVQALVRAASRLDFVLVVRGGGMSCTAG